MKLLILKMLRELTHQKKHIAREDLRNARKSNLKLCDYNTFVRYYEHFIF